MTFNEALYDLHKAWGVFMEEIEKGISVRYTELHKENEKLKLELERLSNESSRVGKVLRKLAGRVYDSGGCPGCSARCECDEVEDGDVSREECIQALLAWAVQEEGKGE